MDLHVARGDRVTIVGPNGSGKTTLLAALLGRVELSSGTQWLGASVVLGEIDQVRQTFDPADSLLDAFRARTRAEVADTRTLLAKFDEPTNHLDLAAIESLEQALESFDGTLLLVSHDRRLLERVETNRALVVENGKVSEL